MIEPVAARLVLVNSTSSSFPFVAGLAGPNRVVITATNSYAQRYHTVFPGMFIRALSASEADADKNGRISMLEAFTHASRLVARHYEVEERMATERAVINDTGVGPGRDAAGTGPDGDIAGLTCLDVATVAKVADPVLQALLERQQALTDEIDALRRGQAALPAEEFEREFERLIIDLALVSRDVRRRGKL
jgi:hypothetical protein